MIVFVRFISLEVYEYNNPSIKFCAKWRQLIIGLHWTSFHNLFLKKIRSLVPYFKLDAVCTLQGKVSNWALLYISSGQPKYQILSRISHRILYHHVDIKKLRNLVYWWLPSCKFWSDKMKRIYHIWTERPNYEVCLLFVYILCLGSVLFGVFPKLVGCCIEIVCACVSACVFLCFNIWHEWFAKFIMMWILFYHTNLVKNINLEKKCAGFYLQNLCYQWPLIYFFKSNVGYWCLLIQECEGMIPTMVFLCLIYMLYIWVPKVITSFCDWSLRWIKCCQVLQE